MKTVVKGGGRYPGASVRVAVVPYSAFRRIQFQHRSVFGRCIVNKDTFSCGLNGKSTQMNIIAIIIRGNDVGLLFYYYEIIVDNYAIDFSAC